MSVLTDAAYERLKLAILKTIEGNRDLGRLESRAAALTERDMMAGGERVWQARNRQEQKVRDLERAEKAARFEYDKAVLMAFPGGK